ncbi:Acg family FMN-binding oxidoreductase [Deinococcus alpinitundrae]|uniref:Acg family FMN-binding oxidoreductase n=1 Tax=Deinococcus alpinitundrae TaxID=468913 RepID=UPI00137A0C19|nr:Tat pathway signal protein [Deinococcus alpinitundrae]
MNRPAPNPNRRQALKILGLVGAGVVVASGGYALYEYQPWASDAADRTPPSQGAAGLTPLRELVWYASLAASGHNTQPWKFALLQNAVEIHPDLTRHLAAVDPDDRELWISLGCALENLLVAARAGGYAVEVTYPVIDDVIRVRLTRDTAQITPHFAAILTRQNTRSVYDGRSVQSAHLEKLRTVALEPGVSLHFSSKRADVETVIEYVNQGNLKQYADQAYLKELVYWLRFDKREALATLDGLYTRSSGNPVVPRWLGARFVIGLKPQVQADADAAKLRSSAGTVVIASTSDDKASWVRVGQVYERLALEMTALNLKLAFLNQPMEVPGVRRQFGGALNLGQALPQLLVRYGHADPMPRSLRRPVEQVLL